jgi:1-acyl-sn-glycerol-3-phosphate acyltransferase
MPLLFGHRIKGRENLRGLEGAVLVSNHCMYLDPAFVGSAIFPGRAFFSIREETIKIRGFGLFLRLLWGFPLPDSRPMDIAASINDLLGRRGKWVHFFPEGELSDFCQEIADFHSGAFYFAIKNNVPVVPVTNVLHRRYIFGLQLPKPFVRVISVIGEAKTVEVPAGNTKKAAEEFARLVRQEMQQTLDNYAGDKSLFAGIIDHLI